MDQLGTVSSEGGPFLIADARAARTWRGAEEGSRDYDAACSALEQMGRWRWGIPWHLDGLGAAVWEPGGPGTSWVFRREDGGLVLVRGWFDGDWDAAAREAATKPRGGELLGNIDAPSHVLVVLWSPENGNCILEGDLSSGNRQPSGDISIDGSSLVIGVAHQRFQWYLDDVRIPAGDALRCFIEPA